MFSKIEKIIAVIVVIVVLLFLGHLVKSYAVSIVNKPARTGCENNVYSDKDYIEAKKYYDWQIENGNPYPVWYRDYRNYLSCMSR